MVKLKKIRSATILETVIALTVILIIFSLASTILISTTLSSISVNKIKGREALKLYSARTKQERAFFDEEIKQEEFTMRREIKSGLYAAPLIQIQYSVSSVNGTSLDTWQEIIRE